MSQHTNNIQSAHTDAASSQKLMTPSNIITIIRICLVPVFVVALLSPWPEWFSLEGLVSNETKSIIAVALFVLISCTDWLDGYLARSRNEVTDFGKFADPLADKILVIAALLALIELQVLPSWPVLIIVIREFIVSGIRMLAATQGFVIAASWYGKAKTVTQIIAIILFLLKDSVYFPDINDTAHDALYVVAWIVMIIALVLTILSMLDYIAHALPLFKNNASKASTERSEEHGAQSAEVQTSTSCSLAERAEKKALAVIEMCTKKRITVGTAESLTGGLIASYLTSIAGSSSSVLGGVVSYAYSVKSGVLGVDPHLLQTDGAVNAQTAAEMASGCAKVIHCDIAVSATGIAGPGGAEPNRPVGTVFMGICSRDVTTVHEFHFEGSREEVRLQTVISALDLINQAAEEM